MSVELYRESPGKFDSRTLNRKILIGGLGVFEIPPSVSSCAWPPPPLPPEYSIVRCCIV